MKIVLKGDNSKKRSPHEPQKIQFSVDFLWSSMKSQKDHGGGMQTRYGGLKSPIIDGKFTKIRSEPESKSVRQSEPPKSTTRAVIGQQEARSTRLGSLEARTDEGLQLVRPMFDLTALENSRISLGKARGTTRAEKNVSVASKDNLIEDVSVTVAKNPFMPEIETTVKIEKLLEPSQVDVLESAFDHHATTLDPKAKKITSTETTDDFSSSFEGTVGSEEEDVDWDEVKESGIGFVNGILSGDKEEASKG